MFSIVSLTEAGGRLPTGRPAFPGRTVPLYLGFAATGVGVALPGAILPTLLRRWHLGDEQGGRLFLLAWIGSSVGALLVRGSLTRMIAVGSFGIAVASGWLALSSARAMDVANGADLLLLLYGMGLGVVMTATTILRLEQTADLPGGGREMVRLNLMWAIGACACPSLAVHALSTGRIGAVLGSLAGFFVGLGLWAATREKSAIPRASSRGGFRSLFGQVPGPLIVMTALVPGVEASAGAWLATYAGRGGLRLGAMVEAPTCLWAGLLISRLCWSLLPSKQAQLVVRGSLMLMSFAAVLLVSPLVAADGGVLLLVAAALLGIGIGPTYPLLVAATSRFHRGGAIFFLAGVGSGCLPWMMGMVSGRSSSLRVGFVVPLAATVLILLLALISPPRVWPLETGDD